MTKKLPKTILLVDDNLFFLKLMERVFSKHGYVCLVAASAEEAITLLKTSEKPDIILSDYEMLEMNGLEFRKHLMADAILKDIPFVFLTYHTEKDIVIKGLDLQAIDYVIKDTPVNVIVSKVNNILFTIEKQRELTELDIKKAAASLNFKSIPASPPTIQGFDIDFWHRAYHDIPGGDFIDFIRVDERYTFIVLGDVMGKKWMAWFFSFGFLSYIRSAVRFAASDHEYSTANILFKVNNIICLDDVLKDILSSMALLLVDTTTGNITYSGAGDLPLLHYKAAKKNIDPVSSSGLLLGLFEQGVFNEQVISLAPGDKLFVFTDGMIDFADATGNKSDYNMFSKMLLPNLKNGEGFAGIKGLFDKGLNTQVDDRSIICINKT